MIGWFPVSDALLNDPAYQGLTTAEQLYLWYIVSEYSLRGPFYKSDLEIAVTLALSEDKVRRARRIVGSPTDRAMSMSAQLARKTLSSGLGWVVYTPGWKRGRDALATQYIDVPVATVPEGVFFAKVHRFTLESLLNLVRAKILTHQDVIVWLVLSYLYWRYRGKCDDHRFHVGKEELRALSGVVGAPSCVRRLHDKYRFTDGARLFDYSDQHQRIVFNNWTWCSDPSENDVSLKNHDRYRRDIAERVRKAKAPTPKRKPRTRAGVR